MAVENTRYMYMFAMLRLRMIHIKKIKYWVILTAAA